MPTLPTPEPRGPSRTAYLLTHVLGVPALLACLAWWINASGLDMTIARTLFDPAIDDFPLHTSRWLELIGHRMVLALPIGVGLGAVGVALVASRVPAWKPARGVALAVAATCLLGQLAVSQLKHYTTLPRPYDLETLGGYTPYPLHWWTWVRARAGGALPSGHAGAGYAMLSLYFAGWALGRPAWRWGGLALGLGAGLGFSAVRVLQGAHFLSQTVWSAALLWFLGAVVFYPLIAGRGRLVGASGQGRRYAGMVADRREKAGT